MDLKHIWGYGHLKVVQGSKSVFFNERSYMKLAFSNENIEYRNEETGEIHIKHLGYRAIIEGNIVYTEPAQKQLFYDLLKMVTNTTTGYLQIPVKVYPHFEDLGGCNLNYEMFLVDDITFQDIEKIEAGQEIQLKFKSKHLIKTLPTVSNNPTGFNAGGYSTNPYNY